MSEAVERVRIPSELLKERGILFSAPMVRALRNKSKWQTRRIVKPQPDEDGLVREIGDTVWQDTGRGRHKCPYGHTGDRLWVRETWGIDSWKMLDGIPKSPPEWLDQDGGVLYRADGECCDQIPECCCATEGRGGLWSIWRPSIHMPRWASRITLELTNVRVERVQSISEADIAAEGVTIDLAAEMIGKPKESIPSLRDAWLLGWSHINGRESWDSNPWVWALSFRPVEKKELAG